jgi:ATP-binding cassette, subfamily C (CFTR/MRP), member 1
MIRAFSWQSAFIAQNHTLVDRSQKPLYLLMIMQRWPTVVLELIIVALAVLIVVIAFKVRGNATTGSGSVSESFTGLSLT